MLKLIIVALSAVTATLADSMQYERCYCQTPTWVGRADGWCYKNNRLDTFQCTIDNSGYVSRTKAAAYGRSQGIRCSNVDDRSTCIDVPDVATYGVTMSTYSNEICWSLVGNHEVCVQKDRFWLDGGKKHSLGKSEKRFHLECDDICRTAFPNDISSLSSVCSYTATSGRQKGRELSTSKEVDSYGKEWWLWEGQGCFSEHWWHIKEA